jgi:POT family proton-dependent oligopeptide transporter
MSPAPPVAIAAGNGDVFGHPRGLVPLFLTGMWEVFAIFGMRTALIYYLVKGLRFSEKGAVQTYAIASAACVLMGLFGSLAADRLLGSRRAIILGALLMALGSFSLVRAELLYMGLGLMAVGNGLFKSPMVARVGALYHRSDPRRERGLVVYKVGCNIGALAAPIVCGTIGTLYGWNRAFVASGLGMLVSIATFRIGVPSGTDEKQEPSIGRLPPFSPDPSVPRRTYGFLVLAWIGSVLFWVAYRQIESTVALWADRGVSRGVTIAGRAFVFPAAWFQSLNPLLIFVFAPLVTRWWSQRDPRGSTGRDLAKMTVGCLQLAAAFSVMGAAALLSSGTGVEGAWVVLAIALLTLGELYVDPIGQALFSRQAVRGLSSLFVSFWFVASLAAYFVAALLGSVWSHVEPALFFALMACTAALGALLMMAARALNARRTAQSDELPA